MEFKQVTLPRDLLTAEMLNLPDGQITVLLGENGSGKSTLLAELAQRVSASSYLPQKNVMYDAMLVADLLALGQSRATAGLAVDVIAALALEPLLARDVQSLSGGQQQRVWLAFVLLQNAPLVLLDEPLAALDLRYQKQVLALLPKLKTTILVVLHDLNQAAQVAEFVWLLREQQILAGPTNELLTADELSQTFSVTVTRSRDGYFIL
ncbi:MAG TPA: ABC transporter ATP-binding protein [Lactobacillaceae bacterium]|jgi:ABC-type cobalamin/Fe3+-siderophores transport system ATPase subunit